MFNILRFLRRFEHLLWGAGAETTVCRWHTALEFVMLIMARIPSESLNLSIVTPLTQYGGGRPGWKTVPIAWRAFIAIGLLKSPGKQMCPPGRLSD